METATALLIGYRGSKVHAVDMQSARNFHATDEAMSLCGWKVTVSEMPFVDMGSIACRICAKAAKA